MKIAVSYENGEVFQHFGHTEKFKLYEIEGNEVKSEKIIDTNGSGHSALADFLIENNVDTLICGGIGGGAKNALSNAGIRLYGGVTGDVDTAVNDFIAGKLNFNPDVSCSHHEHHDDNHSCGIHSCGRNGCH